VLDELSMTGINPFALSPSICQSFALRLSKGTVGILRTGLSKGAYSVPPAKTCS
jgi:hypothetical protein